MEKIFLVEGIETTEQLAMSYSTALPLLLFLGATAAFPAIPVIPPDITFMDILGVGGISTTINAAPSGEAVIEVNVEVGDSIINDIIEYIEDNLETIETAMNNGTAVNLSMESFYTTYIQPTVVAVQVFFQVLQDYINNSLLTYVMGLVNQVLDALGELADPIISAWETVTSTIESVQGMTRAEFLQLLETAAYTYIPGFATLMGLITSVNAIVGRAIAGWQDMMATLPTIKSNIESQLASVQAQITRESGLVIDDIRDLDDYPEVDSVIQQLFPGFPSFSELIAILDLVDAINDTVGLPISMEAIMALIPLPPPLDSILPEIYDTYVKIGANLDEYNFDPDSLSNYPRREIEQTELQIQQAWNELVSKIGNFSWEQLVGFVLDDLQPIMGGTFPEPKISLTLSTPS
jgi:hypothetical protein